VALNYVKIAAIFVWTFFLPFFLLDVVLLANWSLNNGISFFAFSADFKDSLLAFFLVPLLLIPQRFSKLKCLFHWKLWALISLSVIFFGLAQWQFIPSRNYTTSLLGYTWRWDSIIVWISFLSIQIFLYQRKIGMIEGFCLGVYGAFLAGTLYEIPHFYALGLLHFYLSETRFVIPLIFFCYYCFKNLGFSDLPLLVLSVVPLFLMYPFYYQLPTYVPRLAIFPFLLMIPFRMRSKAEERVKL